MLTSAKVVLFHGREGIGRVPYCYAEGQSVVILRAFLKRTDRTPHLDLKIARRRMKGAGSG